jgi:hypothetical protein
MGIQRVISGRHARIPANAARLTENRRVHPDAAPRFDLRDM